MHMSFHSRSWSSVLLVGGLLALATPLLAKTATSPGLPAGASSNPGGPGSGGAPGAGAPSAQPTPGDPLGKQLPRGVNINSASLEDLLRLPGMTNQRAQAIMRNRPYTQVDDLVKKKVLKASTFDRIKPYIIVN
jgi:DNA uptake protein ComE-like DNA-binding protein